MAEVVEAEIVDLSGLQGLYPGLSGEEGAAAGIGEDQIGIYSPQLGVAALASLAGQVWRAQALASRLRRKVALWVEEASQ